MFIESALLLGLVKGLGLKGILAKLGLAIKVGGSKTFIGKAGADIGVLLGLAGGAVIAEVLFEKAVKSVNAQLTTLGYDFSINVATLKGAKAIIAGIGSESWPEYGAEVANGTMEELFAAALSDNGYDELTAAAYSAGLVQIAEWKYEASTQR